MSAADFYSVLGLEPSATQEDIRRAYRRLVRELHPDGHEGGIADPDRLHAVLEAYSVLGNPERRAAYDDARRRAEATLLWTGLPRSRGWPEHSFFDEADLWRILFRWFP